MLKWCGIWHYPKTNLYLKNHTRWWIPNMWRRNLHFLANLQKMFLFFLRISKHDSTVYKIMSCWTDVKSDTILKQTYILMIIQDDKYLICVVGLYLFLRISDFNTRLYYYVVNQKRPTDSSIKHFFMKSMMVNLSYIRRILDNFHIFVLLDLSIQLMKW